MFKVHRTYLTRCGIPARIIAKHHRPDRPAQFVIEVLLGGFTTVSFVDLEGQHPRYHLGGRFVQGPCEYDLTTEEVV